MKEQDMRAVEGMVRCGIDLEGLCSVFHSFPKAEVERYTMKYMKAAKQMG